MNYDLQKAGMWKRAAAWMFDGILLGILAVAFGFLLSGLLGYNRYSDALDRSYAEYETEYVVEFDITQETYLAMTDAQRQSYDAAYQALTADEEAMHAYNMVLNLTLIVTTVGILLAFLLWEFLIPLQLGSGQTLGKKIFGLGLIRNDGVRLNALQLFTRTVLGKYTIETMIPVYILLMIFWGTMGLAGTLILLAILLAQIVSMTMTRTNSAIHDLMAGTVVVDIASQMVFHSTEELMAFQKQLHAERVSRSRS
ncbi:MAG: RDD family protein [Ruminococcaceae bacterium]|nr:RDD family protein [Oscillospiraceae bacterium]